MSTNTVTFTVPLGHGPADVVISPNGARAYIANELTKTLSVVNTVDRVVLVNIDIVTTAPTSGGFDVAVSPNSAHIYLADDSGNTLSVISAAGARVVKTISLEHPNGVAASNNRVYVSHWAMGGAPDDARRVSVIDTATHTVIASVEVGRRVGKLAVSPDGTRLYVADRELHGTVWVVDTATNTVVGDPIAVGAIPSGAAVSPDGTRVYVTNREDSTVSVIATESVATGP
jgi:YVTN family beta-propeller protein